ncbi:hypothetical protein R3W88_033727 [Solanum pinnatisectum]|uniref:Aminotransferase-like plant mobile domain-containing protein n=1 Tax=Solanum pinnatisectum TaxID=50273 RepID=A0AAV9K288_9SOLN|nr:hypothetical protein R3W88_033727 [Solanum pinnatisectum]
MEEREEVMVSSVDEEVKPIFRVTHFLKPTTKKLPFLPSRLKISCSSLKVQFRGGFSYMKGLSKWIWKKAGIFEGIIASTFKIYRHSDLILALAERWCLETNTFNLPWGEATITLEDMVVLGGFSVLGHFVLKPVKTNDSVDIEKALCDVHKDIRARKTNVGHHSWMEHFAGRGDHLEHVAFLILWLSRYVLPATSFLVVGRALFPIAIYLYQGIPIALAPAILASIYRDMSLLKYDSRFIEDELNLNIRASFHFVQLWAWERFTNLQRKPSNSAAECFPYVVDIVKNWDIIKFYKERDEYVVVGPNMGREIMAFARLVRASELVGMDCVEQYNPYRVSMQFGFDQDVPDCVNHASDHTLKIAWTNYNKPIKDVKLYITSRFIKSDVSRQYLEWWKNQNVAPEVAVHYEKMNAYVCCGVLQKCEMIVIESSDDDDNNIPIFVSLRKRKLMNKEITVPGNNQHANKGKSSGIKTNKRKFEDSNGKSHEDGDGPYVVKEMLNLPDSIELASDGPNTELLTSVVTPKVTLMCTNITEGNMVMGNINNHEKGSSRFEMIDILKLEMRIRNLENINAGKVPIFRTK